MTSAKDDTIDLVRRDQIDQGRRLAAEDGVVPRRTLTAKPGYATNRTSTHGSRQLKGHEAFLKALAVSGAFVEIEKCDGTIYRGRVKHCDKYSVTINVTHIGERDSTREPTAATTPRDRVVFKHDISEFSALTPPPLSDSKTPEGHAV